MYRCSQLRSYSNHSQDTGCTIMDDCMTKASDVFPTQTQIENLNSSAEWLECATCPCNKHTLCKCHTRMKRAKKKEKSQKKTKMNKKEGKHKNKSKHRGRGGTGPDGIISVSEQYERVVAKNAEHAPCR